MIMNSVLQGYILILFWNIKDPCHNTTDCLINVTVSVGSETFVTSKHKMNKVTNIIRL
jgi:hypothetical protein